MHTNEQASSYLSIMTEALLDTGKEGVYIMIPAVYYWSTYTKTHFNSINNTPPLHQSERSIRPPLGHALILSCQMYLFANF